MNSPGPTPRIGCSKLNCDTAEEEHLAGVSADEAASACADDEASENVVNRSVIRCGSNVIAGSQEDDTAHDDRHALSRR